MSLVSPPESTPSLRGRFKAATRDAILEAAASVCARDGAAQLRMEEIAASAGVAVGTLYNYFQDRSALVRALLELRTVTLLEGLDAASHGEAPFLERLAAFVQALGDHFEANRYLLGVLLGEETSQGHEAKAVSCRKSVTQEILVRAEALMCDGVRARALRDGDPAAYAVMLVGMVRGMVIMRTLSAGTVPLTDTAPEMVRVFLHGAAAR
jgi:AcrR family transcriptional regulator